MKIKLKTNKEAREFFKIAERFDFEIDLIKGNNTIDGHSIIGILSLISDQEITIMTISDNKEKENEFIELIRKFEV